MAIATTGIGADGHGDGSETAGSGAAANSRPPQERPTRNNRIRTMARQGSDALAPPHLVATTPTSRAAWSSERLRPPTPAQA